jgi:hypothetical protein
MGKLFLENEVIIITENEAGSNCGFGSSPLPTGTSNTWTGYGALANLTTGARNSAAGANSLNQLTEGNDNTAHGQHALLSLTTGSRNTAVGSYAGISNTTGSENVYIGYNAGEKHTGTGSVFIGNSCANEETIGDFLFLVGSTGKATGCIIRGNLEKQEVAFLGAAPVKRAAHPTTLAEVITILKNLGFCE